MSTNRKSGSLARTLLLAAITLFCLPARAETIEIVGFGDSLMAGYQLPDEDGFTRQLEARLKADGLDVVVANAGVSGDTSSGGRDRLDWSVPDTTDIVILELGANDALRGISPAITRENIDAMIASLKARNIDVVLAGMLAPPNMGPAYGETFNAIWPDMAAKHGVLLDPFFLDGVAAQPALLLEDGMHPNRDGVSVMVERIAPLVADAVRARLAAGG